MKVDRDQQLPQTEIDSNEIIETAKIVVDWNCVPTVTHWSIQDSKLIPNVVNSLAQKLNSTAHEAMTASST
jgi:hypothetical protein